jgi:hypothetical protein
MTDTGMLFDGNCAVDDTSFSSDWDRTYFESGTGDEEIPPQPEPIASSYVAMPVRQGWIFARNRIARFDMQVFGTTGKSVPAFWLNRVVPDYSVAPIEQALILSLGTVDRVWTSPLPWGGEDGPRELRETLVAEFAGKVDAVYLSVDRHDGVHHVYVVVEKHRDEAYNVVLAAEDCLITQYPDITFDFHVRARNGRSVAEAAPSGAQRLLLG